MAPPDLLAPAEGRHPLTAVLSATFFVRFGFGITVAVFATYILGRSVGLNGAQVGVVGLVSAMAPTGEFTTVLLSGAIADRYGRFPVLFGGMAGSAILLALTALTRDPWALGALNFAFGVGSGAILASSLALIADRSAHPERGYEMGRFDAVNLVGWIGGFAFGFGSLGLLDNAELPAVFRAGAAALAIGILLGVWWVPSGWRTTPNRSYVFSTVLPAIVRREVLLVTLPWLVIYMLIGTAFVFLGTSASGVGIPPLDLALAIGLGGLLLVGTQPAFGRLADRFGQQRLMIVGTVGFVGAMICAALLANLGAQIWILGALGVSVLAALAYGPAALAALADLTASLSRATTMAIYSLVISLGMIVGLAASTSLFGALGNLGLDLFFGSIAAGLALLTALRTIDLRRAARSGSA
ncbi:MAG: MFS transporter [Thermoplasmata archaeon]|jgi:AAHS family benzoate transporter-like MFS transporter